MFIDVDDGSAVPIIFGIGIPSVVSLGVPGLVCLLVTSHGIPSEVFLCAPVLILYYLLDFTMGLPYLFSNNLD